MKHFSNLNRIYRFSLFLPLSIMFLTGCFFNQPPDDTEIGVSSEDKVDVQVVVRDDQTQFLLPNASVWLRTTEVSFPAVRTDVNGLAIFRVDPNILKNNVEIEVQIAQYQVNRQNITLGTSLTTTVWMVPIDATAIPRATEAVALILSPSPIVSPSATPTIIVTIEPTPTSTPTPTQTNMPTNSPTQIPSSTPDEREEISLIATALQSSSIFEKPDATSTELTYIDPGEHVIVLQDEGSWILVQNDDGVEGWAAANRFDITLGTPTPVPIIMGVVNESASIFEAPNSNSNEITFIDSDNEVRILGRSNNSTWLFIRTEENIEGWVAASRIELTVNIETLSIIDVTVTTTSTGSGGISPGNFTLDFWNLPGEASCAGSSWTVTLFLEAQGGDEPYTYYIDDVLVAGSVVGNVTKQFSGVDSTSRIYRARVVSSTGQVVSKEILVMPPNCN